MSIGGRLPILTCGVVSLFFFFFCFFFFFFFFRPSLSLSLTVWRSTRVGHDEKSSSHCSSHCGSSLGKRNESSKNNHYFIISKHESDGWFTKEVGCYSSRFDIYFFSFLSFFFRRGYNQWELYNWRRKKKKNIFFTFFFSLQTFFFFLLFCCSELNLVTDAATDAKMLALREKAALMSRLHVLGANVKHLHETLTHASEDYTKLLSTFIVLAFVSDHLIRSSGLSLSLSLSLPFTQLLLLDCVLTSGWWECQFECKLLVTLEDIYDSVFKYVGKKIRVELSIVFYILCTLKTLIFFRGSPKDRTQWKFSYQGCFDSSVLTLLRLIMFFFFFFFFTCGLGPLVFFDASVLH